jgi:hypothetical protein
VKPLLSPDELVARLHATGTARYRDKHPFHALLNSGQCSKEQVQAWALKLLLPISHPPEGRGDPLPHGGPGAPPRLAQAHPRPRRRARGRGRHRQMAAPHPCAWPRSRPRRLDARDPPRNAIRGRGLCALRPPGAHAAGGDRLFAHGAVLDAGDPGGRRRHARALRLRHARDARLFRRAARAGAARRRLALDYVVARATTPETQSAVLQGLESKCDVLWAMHADVLAARFSADRDRIASEAEALLRDLAAKRMVEL